MNSHGKLTVNSLILLFMLCCVGGELHWNRCYGLLGNFEEKLRVSKRNQPNDANFILKKGEVRREVVRRGNKT